MAAVDQQLTEEIPRVVDEVDRQPEGNCVVVSRECTKKAILGDVVEAVQYSLRLLIPPGSLLLDLPEIAGHIDGFDRDRFTWEWHAADPRVDELAAAVAATVAAATERGDGILGGLRVAGLEGDDHPGAAVVGGLCRQRRSVPFCCVQVYSVPVRRQAPGEVAEVRFAAATRGDQVRVA